MSNYNEENIELSISSLTKGYVKAFANTETPTVVTFEEFSQVESIENSEEKKIVNDDVSVDNLLPEDQEAPEVILIENVDTEHHIENSGKAVLTEDELRRIEDAPEVNVITEFVTGEEEKEAIDEQYIKNFDPSAGFDFKNVDIEVLEFEEEKEDQYMPNADVKNTNNNTGEFVDGVYIIQEEKTEEELKNYETSFQAGATDLMTDLSSFNNDLEAVEETAVEEIVEQQTFEIPDFDPTRYFGVQDSARPTRPEPVVELSEQDSDALEAIEDFQEVIQENAEDNEATILPDNDKGSNRSIADMLKELSSLKDNK